MNIGMNKGTKGNSGKNKGKTEARAVKIFIASSIVELKDERNELSRFSKTARSILAKLKKCRVDCDIQLCENLNQAMSSAGRKQDEYNSLIEQADAVFFLFKSKVGDMTREELEHAREHFLSYGTPLIYTYFKDCEEESEDVRALKEYIGRDDGHYYGTFDDDLESVKLNILHVISARLPELDLKFTISDGVIYLDDMPFVDIDIEKLEYFKKNEEMSALASEVSRLELAGDYEGASKAREAVARCHSACLAALTARYKSIATSVKHDREIQEASNAAAKGDYKRVTTLIDGESLVKNANVKIEYGKVNAKEFYEIEFNKLVMLITALYAQRRYREVGEKYREAIDFIESLNLYRVDKACISIWRDSISFMFKHNLTPTGIEETRKTAERLDGLCEYIPDLVSKRDRVWLWNILSAFAMIADDVENALKYIERSVETLKVLAADNPKAHTGGLIKAHFFAGNYLSNPKVNRTVEAEAHYLDGIRVGESCGSKGTYEIDKYLADCCYRMGCIYGERKAYGEAERYYKKALPLLERLIKEYPEHPLYVNLQMSCEKIAEVYENIGEDKRARALRQRTTEIAELRASRDSSEEMQNILATHYDKLAKLYEGRSDYESAQEYYLKEISVREAILGRNEASKNKQSLASAYHDLAAMYNKRADCDKRDGREDNLDRMLDSYQRAVEYLEKSAEKFEEISGDGVLGSFYTQFLKAVSTELINTSLIAANCCNIHANKLHRRAIELCLKGDRRSANTYFKMAADTYERAIPLYERAVSVCDRLTSDKKNECIDGMALCRENLADIYGKMLSNFDKAYECCEQAIKERKSLSRLDTDKYGAKLAICYRRAADIYSKILSVADASAVLTVDYNLKTEQYLNMAIGLGECLFQTAPEKHGAELAKAYFAYAKIIAEDDYLFRRAYELALGAPNDRECAQIVRWMKNIYG